MTTGDMGYRRHMGRGCREREGQSQDFGICPQSEANNGSQVYVHVLILRTRECDFILDEFADGIKLRILRNIIQVGIKCHHKGPSKRERQRELRHRPRGGGDMTMETEIKVI